MSSVRLVERDAEMLRVGSLLRRAAAGSGALLVIEGPAGIGKSHLLGEACDQAEQDGFRVLRARCGSL